MGQMASGRDSNGKQRDLRTNDNGELVYSDPPLGPPSGGTIVGDDAAHPAGGAATGEGVLTIVNPGPGDAAIGGLGTAGEPPLPTASVGLPVGPGGSYTYRAAALEKVKVYVPAGTTIRWGAHQ